mgnify:CR=1 FL=1
MKKIYFIVVCLLSFNTYSQNKLEIEKILRETNISELTTVL